MRKLLLVLTIIASISASAWMTARAADPFSAEEFAHVHSIVIEGADEQPWQQIPWGTNLWKARQQAAAEGKPILLWEMDGHPLGCT